MHFERPSRRRRSPGLTPLIDVVFLLLVFFMLASRFDREALLPLVVRAKADTETVVAPSDSDSLVVEIGDDGQARIAGRPVASREIEAEAAAAARDERSVRVRPASEAGLQSIVDVLAAIGKSGARDVALEQTD